MHTQALPPKPPNSRVVRGAHTLAQPRPTAPFIFRLLRHGFPAAHPKHRRVTGWAVGSETPCPAPSSGSSRSNPMHQPCLSFPIRYLCPPASQPCQPQGLPPTEPITQGFVKSPGAPRHNDPTWKLKMWPRCGSVRWPQLPRVCRSRRPRVTPSPRRSPAVQGTGAGSSPQCGNWGRESWDSVTTRDLQRELRDSRTL